MIHYWLAKLADSIDREAVELEDSARRWRDVLGGKDTDLVVAKTLRILAKAIRRVTAEADAK